jgi:hypothetical protein
MSKRTCPSSSESALESVKRVTFESPIASSLPYKSPLTDALTVETAITISTTIESLGTDGDAGDSDPKLETPIAGTLPSGVSASAAIASDECEFPAKFVTVMTFLALNYVWFLMGEYEEGKCYHEQLARQSYDTNDAKEYFDDLFGTGDYDYDKVLDALGPDGTPEQRKNLLRAFLVLDENTTCSVKTVFSDVAAGNVEGFLDEDGRLNEDEVIKDFLSHAPVGHCAVEYTALLRSYLEGNGPSLRELFAA